MMSSKRLFTIISVTVSITFIITQNVQAFRKCKEGLKSFGYNGELDHDSQDFINNSPLQSIPWIPGYRAFVNYIVDRIFSTKKILFTEGYTGVLSIDKLLTENKNKRIAVTEYIQFINDKPYSNYKNKHSQFVFDLVYEFIVQKKMITTNEGKDCKKALNSMEYNGNFLHDILMLKKKGDNETPYESQISTEFITDLILQKYLVPNDEKLWKKTVDMVEVINGIEDSLETSKKVYVKKYNRFLRYAKVFVLFTDINSRDVYCDLLAPLIDYGFTGEMGKDKLLIEELNNKKNHPLKEEATIYKGYLDRVKVNMYEAAGLQRPKNYLDKLGLHKLGRILY